MSTLTRRSFIGATLAAPAIVRGGVLMPVRALWKPSAFITFSPPANLDDIAWLESRRFTVYDTVVQFMVPSSMLGPNEHKLTRLYLHRP
jgi:hypothetical protein